MPAYLILCAVLTAISFFLCAGLLAAPFWPDKAPPLLTWLMLACLSYLATQTLVIFFFVGAGVSIKEFVQKHGLSQAPRQASLALKQKLFPRLMGNMGLMLLFWATLGVFRIQNQPLFIPCVIGLLAVIQFFRLIRQELIAVKETFVHLNLCAQEHDEQKLNKNTAAF